MKQIIYKKKNLFTLFQLSFPSQLHVTRTEVGRPWKRLQAFVQNKWGEGILRCLKECTCRYKSGS